MKKIMALVLAAAMAFSLCACGKSGENTSSNNSESTIQVSVKGGALTMLNMSEEENENMANAHLVADRQLAKEGYADLGEDVPAEDIDKVFDIKFYDSLDSMVMALQSGDIGMFSIYNSTAKYLCANNDKLEISGNPDKLIEKFEGVSVDDIEDKDAFGFFAYNLLESHSFSFMMMEDNTDLRDEFNKAIDEMKKDGTLDKLVKEQIDDRISGGEIASIKMPEISDADTIKVAVTGSLPPMDFVAADGTPAGFNTAVLAEISSRIGKNIELVVVDSVGRAAALSSGNVDVVFWTRTNDIVNEYAEMDEADKKEHHDSMMGKLDDDQKEAVNKIESLVDVEKLGSVDMPEGTIITESYYSDILVGVVKKH